MRVKLIELLCSGGSVTGSDYTESLWSVAHQATFLAVAQGLACAFALGKDLIALQQAHLQAKLGISAVAVLFAAGYCAFVIRCFYMAAGVETLSDQQRSVWREITFWRCIAIWLFSAFLPIFGLFAPNLLG
jgi:hypothetical protein